ncbi:MAG: histidine kinase [Bacillota bacterium]
MSDISPGIETDNLLAARIKQLEKQIEDLKQRFPAHSLKPRMFQQLEELEEELAELRNQLPDNKKD